MLQNATERQVAMTHKRPRKLLQAEGVQRNNIEDVIHAYRGNYFFAANENVYYRYCVRKLHSAMDKFYKCYKQR